MLDGRQVYVVHHGLGRGTMGWAHVRVGADDRASAQKLCADLRGAGLSGTARAGLGLEYLRQIRTD